MCFVEIRGVICRDPNFFFPPWTLSFRANSSRQVYHLKWSLWGFVHSACVELNLFDTEPGSKWFLDTWYQVYVLDNIIFLKNGGCLGLKIASPLIGSSCNDVTAIYCTDIWEVQILDSDSQTLGAWEAKNVTEMIGLGSRRECAQLTFQHLFLVGSPSS